MTSKRNGRGAGAEGIVDAVAGNPKIQSAILGLVVDALMMLVRRFTNRPALPPAGVVTKPRPSAADQDPAFPDDVIPYTGAKPTVSKVRLKLARVQLNRKRFPDAYTKENPFGLLPSEEVRKAEAGKQAIPYDSKVWLDLTAYDADGEELQRDRVIAAGLAYHTAHRVGEASIVGGGANADGQPYEPTMRDTEQVSNGWTAWETSLGFLHQIKVREEGSYRCSGSVGGVESNTFTIRVS